MKQKTNFICVTAMIAALYVVLTFIANTFGLASGVIQIRLSEALTVLPFFTPAAIPGLTIGCLLSNWMTGCVLWDIIFGTLATLLGALGSYALRKYPWLADCGKYRNCPFCTAICLWRRRRPALYDGYSRHRRNPLLLRSRHDTFNRTEEIPCATL